MKEMTKFSDIGLKMLLYGAVAAVSTIAVAMLCSLLILKEVLPNDKYALYTAIISALSVGIACLAAFGRKGKGTLPLGIGIASVYYAIVLLAKTVFFTGAAVGLLPRGLIVYLTAITFALLRSGVVKRRGGHRYSGKR